MKKVFLAHISHLWNNNFREEMMLLLKDCMYKNTKDVNDEDGDDGVKVKNSYLIIH